MYHVCDIQDLASHGLSVLAGGRGKPQFLERLIYQFLQQKVALHAGNIYQTTKTDESRGVNSDLDSLFVVDSPDHFDTHFGDLAKARLFQANIPQDLNDPLPHTNTRVLYEESL